MEEFGGREAGTRGDKGGVGEMMINRIQEEQEQT